MIIALIFLVILIVILSGIAAIKYLNYLLNQDNRESFFFKCEIKTRHFWREKEYLNEKDQLK
jgi:hypothetical protein